MMNATRRFRVVGPLTLLPLLAACDADSTAPGAAGEPAAEVFMAKAGPNTSFPVSGSSVH